MLVVIVVVFSCCSSSFTISSILSWGKARASRSKNILSKGLISSKSKRVVTFENVLLLSKSGNRFEIKSRRVTINGTEEI